MEQPPLVTKALAFAAARGFATSCQNENGALLHVLAARRGVMRVGEIGTGAGVGTAWLASALPPTTPLFTTETDPDLAAAVAAFSHPLLTAIEVWVTPERRTLVAVRR